MGGIQHEPQRNLESLGDFSSVELELETRTDEPDHRRHTIAADDQVVGQIADDLDETSLEPDFLLRLAQCGFERVGIARLQASSGKTDLARMVLG